MRSLALTALVATLSLTATGCVRGGFASQTNTDADLASVLDVADLGLHDVADIAMDSSAAAFPPLPCSPKIAWSTQFASDPTAADNNGDSVNDWHRRSGQTFDIGELKGGTWQTVGVTLDTHPPRAFGQHVVAEGRLYVDPQAPVGEGPSLWVWAGHDASDNTALLAYARIERREEPAGQRVVIVAWGQPSIALDSYDILRDGFITLKLDAQAQSKTLDVSVDGQLRGSYTLQRATTGQSGGYASLWAAQPAVVDWLRVVECGP